MNMNKYIVEGKIVLLNPDHIVSATMRKATQHMGWEATLNDSNGGQYKITHPDFGALRHIIVNGQDGGDPV